MPQPNPSPEGGGKKEEMKKTNILKTLSIITLLALCAGRSYADGEELQQLLGASVDPTVSITKSASSVEEGTINVDTGVNSGVVSIFNISTNGDDDDYDFYLSSTFPIDGAARSAYDGSGNIIFGNATHPPTEAAVTDAIAHGTNNRNVILYPVTITPESPMTSMSTTHATYGNCYKITLNGSQNGSLTHTVGTTPITNTYILSQDTSGTYRATITLTAVAK